MKARYKVATTTILVLTAVLVAIPLIDYERESRRLGAERARVCGLIRVGQSIVDAQENLRRSGFRFHSDTPTRFLDYQELLVIIGDTTPSRLDTLLYVIGRGNPLRTESPYVSIAASPDGLITEIK